MLPLFKIMRSDASIFCWFSILRCPFVCKYPSWPDILVHSSGDVFRLIISSRSAIRSKSKGVCLLQSEFLRALVCCG